MTHHNNKWTIIYYYHSDPIHLDHLRMSNPQAQILPIYIKNELSPCEASRNSDSIIRKYIKKIIDNIEYENILLIEWDVYINQYIPDIEFDGMFGTCVVQKDNGWCHWKDAIKLPTQYQPYITGLTLRGFFGIKLRYLQQLLDPIYDNIYDMDIFAEVRTPTLVKSMGGHITDLPLQLTQCLLHSTPTNRSKIKTILQTQPQQTGFFHPVKHKIST